MEDQTEQILASARNSQIAADAARKALADLLVNALRQAIPVGTTLDLRFTKEARPPEYLAELKMVSGNSRGTRLFRVVKVLDVNANAEHPESSGWSLEATPLSELTGNPMKTGSGTTKGGNHDTVLLRGYLTCDGIDRKEGEQLSVLKSFIEGNGSGGGLNRLLGAPHNEKFRPRSQLTALGARNGLTLGDGDY